MIPEAELYQRLESLRNLMIAIVIIMLILALSVLFYVNRRTFKNDGSIQAGQPGIHCEAGLSGKGI
ncbi:hypothetical protein ABES58_24375 [Paenibacillus lautus]|uniref:hypothetical protein n=1 Tax=Paenibacillus lautus TaxID=1401 RepID=UPI003D28AF85